VRGLLNKWTSQGFAHRVGINREPRLYWVFLKSGGRTWAPEIAAKEGPQALPAASRDQSGVEYSERRGSSQFASAERSLRGVSGSKGRQPAAAKARQGLVRLTYPIAWAVVSRAMGPNPNEQRQEVGG
jgi:hypothetical protein